MAQTLEELKAENAAIEAEANNALVEDNKESIQDENVEVTEEIKADDTDGTPEDKGEQQVELESWQLTEEAEASDDDKKSGFVPDAGYAAKRLKGKLKAKDTEVDELKAKLEALQNGTAPQAQPVSELGPRPTREQFDYNDDAYDAAIDAWNDKKFDMKLKSHTQTSQADAAQQAQQEAYNKAQQKSLDDHYGRALKLVNDGKVSEESYNNADALVRQSLDSLKPGNGNNLANALISTLNSLGEGSEKVMYQLGVNPAKMQELKNKLSADPSGLSASAYLGQLQSQVQTPSKRRSQAPKPSANADGEGGSSGREGTFKKAYDKAEKAGDLQGKLNAKRAAKAQKVDTSNW